MEALKLLEHEYYLTVPAQDTNSSFFGQSSDETLSSSSTVLSAAEHQYQ